MHPPGKEKPGLQAGLLRIDDADSISETQFTCNLKRLPPGFAFENGGAVPTIEHATRQPEPEHFTPEQEQAVKFSSALFLWAFHNVRTAKAAALWKWLGHDTRKISEIANDYGITASGIRTEIRNLRKFVAEVES
jgi:hypothetical protein